jgi:pyruvate/2-oxoacid:ferredoxin oxidoreductase beta subunit
LAIGAEASFAARIIDSDRKHLTGVRRQAAHPGTALGEIYQNCDMGGRFASAWRGPRGSYGTRWAVI